MTHTHRQTDTGTPTNRTCKHLSRRSRVCAATCHRPVCPRALLCNCAFKTAVVIVCHAEGADNERTDLGFMMRRLMWQQTPVVESGTVCLGACVFVLVDSTGISVIDSALMERPRGGVWGLITIMKLIMLAGVCSHLLLFSIKQDKSNIILKLCAK